MKTSHPALPTTSGLVSALIFLREAYDCAQKLQLSVWEFAVEIDSLRSTGLSQSNFRWLIGNGYVEHGVEMTRPTNKKRCFRPVRSLTLPNNTCFVLTSAGIDFHNQTIAASSSAGIQRMFTSGCSDTEAVPDYLGSTLVASITNGHPVFASQQPTVNHKPRSSQCHSTRRVPDWDDDLHELRLGQRVIKRFVRRAPSQELILNVFQEEHWAEAIDDPLPMLHGVDSKRRLHHTVRNLNRPQHPHVIHFMINGQGQRISWRLTQPIVTIRR